MIPPDLTVLARETPSENLPALLGALESAKAVAWARLTVPAATIVAPRDTEGNISVEETAHLLGVSDRWIYKNAHRLPFVRRIGRRVLCSARGVVDWNARQRG